MEDMLSKIQQRGEAVSKRQKEIDKLKRDKQRITEEYKRKFTNFHNNNTNANTNTHRRKLSNSNGLDNRGYNPFARDAEQGRLRSSIVSMDNIPHLDKSYWADEYTVPPPIPPRKSSIENINKRQTNQTTDLISFIQPQPQTVIETSRNDNNNFTIRLEEINRMIDYLYNREYEIISHNRNKLDIGDHLNQRIKTLLSRYIDSTEIESLLNRIDLNRYK